MKNITDCEREMYEQKSAGSPILCSIYEESCFVHCIVAQTEKKKHSLLTAVIFRSILL
jgi:hypothetical protein